MVGEIIKFCLSNGLECERDGIVPTLYTIIVNYALATNSTVPLGHKSVDEVHKIEREYHHNLEVYNFFINYAVEIKHSKVTPQLKQFCIH